MVFLVIIVLHGLLNTFGVDLVKLLSDVSAWWHVVGVGVIVVVLVVVPDHHYSIGKVFTQTVNNTGLHGAGGAIYAFLLGLLMAQYTFTGYDASAHLSEETHDASHGRTARHRDVRRRLAGRRIRAAVRGHLGDPGLRGRADSATGFPPAQIFIDAAGRHTGEFLLLICVVAQFFCGMASVTANSRMAFAFSRDGALPGSRLWQQVNPRTGTPTNSIWLCVVCCDRAGRLPSLKNIVRVRRGHRDRGHRPLRRLRDPGLPAAARPRLPGRPVEPRQVEQADRLDRGRLGAASSA